MFRFPYCSNHYYSGCQNKPQLKHKNKEMCLQCYAQLIYEDLEYGIKYGESKDLYLLLYYNSSHRQSQRAFKIKK